MALLPSMSTRALKFEQPGTTYSGTLIEIGQEQQAQKYSPSGTGGPDYWDEEKTRPKMQRKFTIVVADRDPQDPLDDGKRALYAVVNAKQGSIYHAINKALEPATDLGGTLTVTYTGNDPESKNPANPRKLYSATYTDPTPSQRMGNAAPTQPAAAPQATSQAAPQANSTPAAPADEPAEGFTAEGWAALTDDIKATIRQAQQ